MAMLADHAAASPLDAITPVADAALISRLVDVVRTIHVAAPLRQYAVDISNATRQHPDVRLGASPRATLHLVRAAKAAAALDDRDHVLPDDLQTLAPHVLSHRLILTADAQIAGRTTSTVVSDVLRRVAVPVSARV
jgi:MoxR-like ATPase